MLIVLDTTETFADLRMEGANYTLLRSFVATHPVKLVVPQIVVEETVNHFKESLTEQLNNVRSTMRSLARLVPDASLAVGVDLDVGAEVQKYREHLQSCLARADQPSYDTVGVNALVQRALARKRPFDLNGKAGFRDAVLWETVLLLAEDTVNEIILITRNKRDFGKHGTLHGDLSADLDASRLSHLKVTVCEGLGRFIDEHVKPSLEKLDEIHRQIEEGEYPGFDAAEFFDDWIVEALDSLDEQVKRCDLNRLTQGSVYHYREPRLSDIEPSIEGFRVSDVWRVNKDQFSVGIDYFLGGSVECYRETIFDFYDEPYDEEFVGDVKFTLLMTLVIEQKSGGVVSWELHDIDLEATGDWGFPDDYE